MCIKKKSFKAKLGKSCHWHSRLAFQGAAEMSLRMKIKFFGGPGVKPLKQQALMTRHSPAQSTLALKGAQVTKQYTVSG